MEEEEEAREQGLDLEQRFALQRLALEAQEMGREELIVALVAALESWFELKAFFLEVARSSGISFSVQVMRDWEPPETPEEFLDRLGYVPTPEQADDYLKECIETATMELDMDEIVRMPDE